MAYVYYVEGVTGAFHAASPEEAVHMARTSAAKVLLYAKSTQPHSEWLAPIRKAAARLLARKDNPSVTAIKLCD